MLVKFTGPVSGTIALWLTQSRQWDNGNDAESVRAHYARTIDNPDDAAFAYMRWLSAVCGIVAPILRDNPAGVTTDVTIDGALWTFMHDIEAEEWV